MKFVLRGGWFLLCLCLKYENHKRNSLGCGNRDGLVRLICPKDVHLDIVVRVLRMRTDLSTL